MEIWFIPGRNHAGAVKVVFLNPPGVLDHSPRLQP